MNRAEVVDRLEEAAAVLRRLPDKERQFLKAGERCHWPTVLMTFWEAWAAYGKQAVKMKLPPPSAAAIDRASEVLDWMLWLTQEHGGVVMKCVWLAHGERRQISTISAILGFDRKTIRKKRDFGVAVLVLRLAAHKKAA